MEIIETGKHRIDRDGQEVSAEVAIRVRPIRSATGVGFSGEVQRHLNSRFTTDRIEASDAIWHSIRNALQEGEWRLAKRNDLIANTFQAEVVHVRVSANASQAETKLLLTEASRRAVQRYFADLDEGRITLTASSVDAPFSYIPSMEFDEEFLSRRPCFLEYAAEKRRGFLFGYAATQATTIAESRLDRTLGVQGAHAFPQAVYGYLCGCRPEADALVARSLEMLSLADEIGEKGKGDFATSWGKARLYTALAYVHWLATGERHETAIAKAIKHNLAYYRRAKTFDRRSANLAAPTLMFLGADSVLVLMAERLAARGGKVPKTPGGLFGDALRIATASSEDERDQLKAKLRKRIPLHLFRWMHHGYYDDVAFMLYALFPRPEGPPSRLIERAWDVMPEIERQPGVYFGWDIAKRKQKRGT